LCTIHDYGRGGTPFLASPDGPSLIFVSFRFLNNFLALKNRVSLKLFAVLKYFLSFTTFENFEKLALALKNRVCSEIFYCIEIFFIFQDLRNLPLPLK